jgi:hypothetical protein
MPTQFHGLAETGTKLRKGCPPSPYDKCVNVPETEEHPMRADQKIAAELQAPPQFVATYDFFDVKRLRLVERLPDEQLDFLHENSKRAEMKPGNPVPGYLNDYLIINLPRRPALESIAEIPEAVSNYYGEILDPMVNYSEDAHDFIIPEGISAQKFQKLFNKHFVARWHGDKVSAYDHRGTTSYSDRERISIDDRDVDERDDEQRGHDKDMRGHSYRWYWDKPCKISKQWNCFHFEVLHEGQHAVQQIGIHHPRDCLTFDFAAHRRKYLDSQLYRLDFLILGLSDYNRQHKSRWRTPITESGKNFFRAWGSAVYNKYGRHPDWVGDEAGNQFPLPAPGDLPVSLQRFVDIYGRGDFLIPITMLDLLRMAAAS